MPGTRLTVMGSGRANVAEKLGHLIAQLLALRFQRLGGVLDVIGGGCCRIGVGLHARDVLGDVLGALRGELRAAREINSEASPAVLRSNQAICLIASNWSITAS